ncbi:MAG: Gfo/Idh/MocA family oxidoreductase [Candidatus Coatesbacteria bacterium]
MAEVRIGVVGVGGMGGFHADYLQKGKVNGARLTAVCDVIPKQMDRFEGVKKYGHHAQLLASGDVDAVIVATPHYDHTTVAIAAFERGIHVLTEKPLAVHKADGERMIAAHRKTKVVFAIMHQMRTSSVWKKVKQLLVAGELGEIRRVNWIVTDWFRPQSYYDSGGWRATWKGEGGGVLMNQCPHNLDLLWWWFGLPKRIVAQCRFGQYHDIEVEDDVTAYLEYPNGSTGVFVTTTGEAPGTNRLEVAGDRGKLVVEHGEITFVRTEVSVTGWLKTSKESFSSPPTWTAKIPSGGDWGGHHVITQGFVDAILNGTEPIVRGEEGLGAVELANAMIYSAVTGSSVDVPLDAAAYEAKLKVLAASSRFKNPASDSGPRDMNASFK